MISGGAAWLSCLDVFNRRGRGTPLPMDAPRHLVTSGLFARTRNPIMSAELGVILGESIYFVSAGILAYALAMSVLAHLLIVHVEEPELRGRFGESYDRYSQRVPRWLPALGRRPSSGS